MTPLLTPKETSRLFSISTRKLWELTKRGEIGCVRIGRSVRYDPADLQNWIENHKEGPGTDRKGGQSR